jgi:urea transport system ATP-binding protein
MDEGELRVIIGPNGAGKSTMMDLITGRTRPDSGKIEFGRTYGPDQAQRISNQPLGIGRKFQTPSVYMDHTVFENVLLSLKGPRSVFVCVVSPHLIAGATRAD